MAVESLSKEEPEDQVGAMNGNEQMD